MTRLELKAMFLAFLEEHKRILYKVCNTYCRNRNDREDLAQEIIVQLWRSMGSFDERCRFSTWMYRIALNVAISFHRRESTRSRYVLSNGTQLLAVVDESVNQQAEIREFYQLIEKQEPLNKALILLYLDGNSYLEIAEVLGISETNVATKISRLKRSMKRDLMVDGE